jgi:hypothetical protein
MCFLTDWPKGTLNITFKCSIILPSEQAFLKFSFVISTKWQSSQKGFSIDCHKFLENCQICQKNLPSILEICLNLANFVLRCDQIKFLQDLQWSASEYILYIFLRSAICTSSPWNRSLIWRFIQKFKKGLFSSFSSQLFKDFMHRSDP